jgi:hypothetical protein
MKSIHVGLLPRRQKERFDRMSAPSPIPINANAMWESILIIRPETQSQNPSWRQVSRPCAFGIVGLAIAVFLWGYGYKLSLYHRHSESSSQVSVAKMWIGPRSASVVAASRSGAQLHRIAGSLAFTVPIQHRLWLSRTIFCIFPVSTRSFASLDFLIPSRAPPPHRSYLARVAPWLRL